MGEFAAILQELSTIFLNVLVPVFALVCLGYLVGPRLNLDSRTIARYAYFILAPAFTFTVLANSEIEAALILQMTGYMVVVELGCAAVALTVAWLLRRSASMTAIYVSAAVFGNVGNFGFPIIQFAFDEQPDRALGIATIYFLVVMVIAFVISVAAANWHRGGGLAAVLAVLKTPALLVVPPAILVNWAQIDLPLMVERPVDLLAGGLIPTMLIALGVQLANAGIPRPNLDMIVASGIRLLVSPLIAIALAAPFGMRGLERDVGILQSSMPIAILVSMIAAEYDLEPAFVTGTVIFSTLVSVVTLAVVIALL